MGTVVILINIDPSSGSNPAALQCFYTTLDPCMGTMVSCSFVISLVFTEVYAALLYFLLQ